MDIINNGILGKLNSFQGNYSFPSQERESNIMNNALGGGSLNDSAGYPIYASRMRIDTSQMRIEI